MRHKSLTPEQRRERLHTAHQQLTEAVENLTTSDGWRAMVQARAWLRRYSLSNLLMILMQNPDATDVRPLREWNQVGRRVRKGEHGLRIWAPRFRRAQTEHAETTSDDDDTTQVEQYLAGFILVSVFDVSQTEGEPLPSASNVLPTLLTGDAPAGLWDAVAAQITAAGFRIERGDCGSANGVTEFTARIVRVRADVEPAQAAKTLTHELAHILCEHDKRHDLSREVGEIEAESVACIVAAACGLSTLDYSVPYVANWASDVAKARESAERVLAVADRVLARVEQGGHPVADQPAAVA